jgi:hypothetical protein
MRKGPGPKPLQTPCEDGTGHCLNFLSFSHQAIAAQKFREQQEMERRRHLDELRFRDEVCARCYFVTSKSYTIFWNLFVKRFSFILLALNRMLILTSG